MRRLAILLLPLVLLLLPGCSKGCGRGGGTQAERLRVSVSIFPVYDLVRRVAGPDADVGLILPPGRDPHAFEPTAKESETAARSNVGVLVGLGLDPWMEKLMTEAAPKARLLKVGDRVPTLTAEGDPLATDPHVWLDPARTRLIVRAIAEELGRADSAHAIAYRTRATELDASLASLDAEIEGRMTALRKREIVTFHGSFRYFAERFKLDIIAVIEPVPGSPPSAEHLAEVLEKKNVPALFREPQRDPRPAQVLAEKAKIPLGVLDPIGGGPETDSYETLIRFDAAQLEKHLK